METFKDLLIMDLKRLYINKGIQFNSNTPHLNLIIIKYVLITRSFRAIFFYRLINKKLENRGFLKEAIESFSALINRVCIPSTAEIGGGLFFGHMECVIIHQNAVIGENATILHGVTIGGNIGKTRDGRDCPVIGDNVLLGAGAKVLGPIKIGDNSMIGANSVVTTDIPRNSVVVGVPGRVVKEVKKSYIEIEKGL